MQSIARNLANDQALCAALRSRAVFRSGNNGFDRRGGDGHGSRVAGGVIIFSAAATRAVASALTGERVIWRLRRADVAGQTRPIRVGGVGDDLSGRDRAIKCDGVLHGGATTKREGRDDEVNHTASGVVCYYGRAARSAERWRIESSERDRQKT